MHPPAEALWGHDTTPHCPPLWGCSPWPPAEHPTLPQGLGAPLGHSEATHSHSLLLQAHSATVRRATTCMALLPGHGLICCSPEHFTALGAFSSLTYPSAQLYAKGPAMPFPLTSTGWLQIRGLLMGSQSSGK